MAGELPQDCLSIVRERFVGDGMQDTIRIQNQSMQPLSFELGLEVGSDFAEIMSAKERRFFLGDPLNANPLPPLGQIPSTRTRAASSSSTAPPRTATAR